MEQNGTECFVPLLSGTLQLFNISLHAKSSCWDCGVIYAATELCSYLFSPPYTLRTQIFIMNVLTDKLYSHYLHHGAYKITS